jgi:hypothetical protein
MGTCTYAVNATTSRIDLRLQLASGACPGTDSATTAEFAGYPTAKGGALLLELDTIAMAGGSAFLQSAPPSTFTGSVSFRLAGQGLIHNAVSQIQANVTGQLQLPVSTINGGTIDVNNFSAVFPNDPVNILTTVITATTAPGRGTAVISGTNPNVTFNVAYYVIDATTAVIFDTDATRNMIGAVTQQF